MPSEKPSVASTLENLKTISWYISLLCGEQQNLEKNTEYAKKLGKLIKDILTVPPYSICFLCSVHEIYYGEQEKLQADAEFELVGRGSMDPRYRAFWKDSDCYANGIILNNTLATSRKSDISIDRLESLAIYIYLLLHSQAASISELTKQSLDIEYKFKGFEESPYETLLSRGGDKTELNKIALPLLKILNPFIKNLCNDLSKDFSKTTEQAQLSFFSSESDLDRQRTKSITIWDYILEAMVNFFKKIAELWGECTLLVNTPC